ncbi:hypothetical protein HPB52_009956 [Rhipicephalus sanguineus]|uniref:Uncharacterized protein n=1 Tax=Rhipicephalus sanguineus TaxID=34632 RepID=A0A9D4PQY9_RHISA|nr:hypothetical protein HPB52_009956 [Rhipicephalus sanguineus]
MAFSLEFVFCTREQDAKIVAKPWNVPRARNPEFANSGSVRALGEVEWTTSNQTRQWQPKHTQPSLVQVASQAGSRAHQLQGRAHLLEGVGLAHVAQLASGVHALRLRKPARRTYWLKPLTMADKACLHLSSCAKPSASKWRPHASKRRSSKKGSNRWLTQSRSCGEIGRRQEERLRRLEGNLSPLATLATSTMVVLPQQPMPGQQLPQPPQ